ncbi:hypothetical protein GCM10008910_03370 [Faecalicatena orotica]
MGITNSETDELLRGRRREMILLGIVILLMAAYLFYALVHPEKL